MGSRVPINGNCMVNGRPAPLWSLMNSSTVHALVELIHRWQQGLDEPGKVWRVLSLDYSKAFDRVDHKILLGMLANTGIPDCLVRWFTSFLCERRQCTKLGDSTSDWCTIKVGVPQGTLFGPVGFLIQISDLQSILDITKWRVRCRKCVINKAVVVYSSWQLTSPLTGLSTISWKLTVTRLRSYWWTLQGTALPLPVSIYRAPTYSVSAAPI